jgi:transposase-like protein
MPRPLSEEQKQEWKERIRLHSDSGQSMLQWCREHQVNYDSMVYWRRQMGANPTKAIERSSFRELSPPLDDKRITIEYQKVQIHMPQNVDPAILIKYLHGLREGP